MTRLPLGRSAITLVVLGAVLFLISSSGQHNGGPLSDGPEWLGGLGWFGFLICLLLLLVVGVVAISRKVGGGRRSAV